MRLHSEWLVRWAIRFAFYFGLGMIMSAATGRAQTEQTSQPEISPFERGALDPLTQEERATAERIARADTRVKQLLGEGGVRLVSTTPVISKRGDSPEKIDLHQREIEVVLFRPEGEVGARVLVNLRQNSVANLQRLRSSQVPFTADDLNDAFQLAMRDTVVLRALGPEAKSFRVQAERTDSEARAEKEVTGLPVRSNDPKDPCYKHRCMQLLFRNGTDYLSMAVNVDLSAKRVAVERGQSK
ncbi:MAG TPA: hypothetical protein VGK01_06365 [Candidatus Angelobacter sp.]|jgi:hypothetical protein